LAVREGCGDGTGAPTDLRRFEAESQDGEADCYQVMLVPCPVPVGEPVEGDPLAVVDVPDAL
jgi:hypothetical protein